MMISFLDSWILLLGIFHFNLQGHVIKVPIAIHDRESAQGLQLTEIGEFGLYRKARPKVPAHLHTGIDIQRPEKHSHHIFSIAKGVVISKRTDGPYAQLIIEHRLENLLFWTVYEHIGEIRVQLYEEVTAETVIARFFNDGELNRYGWQFNHFHFEVLKKRPYHLKPSDKTPERLFSSYSLICQNREDLDRYFYHPLVFLEDRF